MKSSFYLIFLYFYYYLTFIYYNNLIILVNCLNFNLFQKFQIIQIQNIAKNVKLYKISLLNKKYMNKLSVSSFIQVIIYYIILENKIFLD